MASQTLWDPWKVWERYQCSIKIKFLEEVVDIYTESEDEFDKFWKVIEDEYLM